MYSDKASIEEAVKDFERMRSWCPRYQGKWYVVKESTGFRAFRTKKAATRNATESFWFVNIA